MVGEGARENDGNKWRGCSQSMFGGNDKRKSREASDVVVGEVRGEAGEVKGNRERKVVEVMGHRGEKVGEVSEGVVHASMK